MTATLKNVDVELAHPRTNLATNPSFETTSGTVEVRRNLASDPAATTNGTVAGQARWTPRWFGAGGAGKTTLVTLATDGPVITPGARIPTYMRKTWTVAGGVGDTGFDHTVPASMGGLPVAVGKPYTISSYMRASRNPGTGTEVRMRMAFHDAAGTLLAPIHWSSTPLVAGTWVRASLTATAPAGAAFVSIFSDIAGPDSWQVGDTLDGTGLLVEQSPVLGVYFDGSTSTDSDLTASWTSTANASQSILTGDRVADVVTWKCVAIRSTRWSKAGAYSMRLIPTGNPGESVAQAYYFPAGGSRTGKTDTLLATVHLETPLLDGSGARMHLEGGVAPANTVNIANVAGDQDLRVTSYRPGTYTASMFMLPSARGNGDVWVDCTALVEGEYTGPYFEGSKVFWDSYLCDARDVQVVRGGSRDALSATMDVGTLTATLVNSGDPQTDDLVRPNTPVRLVSKVPGRWSEVPALSTAMSDDKDNWTLPVDGHWYDDISWVNFYAWNTPAGPPRECSITRSLTALTPGQQYVLAIRVKPSSENGLTSASVGVTGLGTGPTVATPVGSFVEVSYEFTAVSTVHEAVLTMTNTVNSYVDAYIDTVSLSTRAWGPSAVPVERWGDWVAQSQTRWASSFEPGGPRTLWDLGFVAAGASNPNTDLSNSTMPRTGTYHATPTIKGFPSSVGQATATFTRTESGLQIGRTYRWSLWVRNQTRANRVKIGVTGRGETAWVTLSTTYQEVAHTFTATEETHSLVITGESTADGTTSYFSVDDMALEAAPVWDPLALIPSLMAPTPVFTGTIQDVGTTYDEEGNTFVQILAADSVSSLANTQRYGAVTDGGVGYEAWHERIQRLCTSANVPTNPPGAPAPTQVWSQGTGTSGWSLFGGAPVGSTASLGANPPRYQITRAMGAQVATLSNFAVGAAPSTSTLSKYSEGVMELFTEPTTTLPINDGFSQATNVFPAWGAWSTRVTAEGTPGYFRYSVVKSHNGDITILPGNGFTRALGNLVPGRRYRISVNVYSKMPDNLEKNLNTTEWNFGIDGQGATQATIPWSTYSKITYTFTATSSTHTMRLTNRTARSDPWLNSFTGTAFWFVWGGVALETLGRALNAPDHSIQATKVVSGLTVGQSYTIALQAYEGNTVQYIPYWKVGVVLDGSISYGWPVKVNVGNQTWSTLTHTFTATSTSHTIVVTNHWALNIPEDYAATAQKITFLNIGGSISTVKTASTAVNYPTNSRGLKNTISGLQVGREYTARAQVTSATTISGYKLGVDTSTHTWGPRVNVNGPTGAEVSVTFVATATSHQFTLTTTDPVIYPADNRTVIEDLTVSNARLFLENPDDPYLLQDVVYESTLLNHFNLASNTVGGRWWVDKEGVVQFARAIDVGAVLANFSDVHDSTDPLHVCYTDVSMAYDTRDVINDLTVVNHGRVLNDQSEWVANDFTARFVDQASIDTWGARKGQIDMSMYDPSGELADRADDILLDHSDPGQRIASVTFASTTNLALAAALEIMSLVTVKRMNHTEHYFVINIAHNLTPKKWSITLGLMPVPEGLI